MLWLINDQDSNSRPNGGQNAAAAQVLVACPDDDWKVIFALARFAGMRTPSEVLSLKWEDIDWMKGRIRIDWPKTGLRYCPLFGELRPILKAAQRNKDIGTARIVAQYHGSERNLRTRLIRIIKNDGLKPWPKLFVHLRASRRTELQELFPDHVINSWLVHRSQIAEKHYL